MAYRRSRLKRVEEKRAVKNTVLYIILTIGLVGVLLVFGLKGLTAFTSLVNNIAGKDSTQITQNSPPPPPPHVNIPPDFTNQDNYKVEGTTRAGISVEIFFNGEKKELVADKQGEFSSNFPLKDGQNSFYVKVVDSAGQESASTNTYMITLDKVPPKLEIISPSADQHFYGSQQKQVKIQGQTEAEARVTINDRVAIVRGDGKFDFSTSLNDGENVFSIKSIDKAGNETDAELHLFFNS